MNFVRFVKTPRVSSTLTKKSASKPNSNKGSAQQLSLLLTITTDFSPFAGETQLLCELLSSNGSTLAAQQIQWYGHERDIKVEFPVQQSPLSNHKIVITPRTGSASTDFLAQFLGGTVSHVVGVETDLFSSTTSTRQDTVYRRFNAPTGPIVIAEQAGETIIRHVWDAGIILSAVISYRHLSSLPPGLTTLLKHLQSPAHPLKVLELGTGVGVLGICIALAFPNATVVMTDLPDAQPLVDKNIHLSASLTNNLTQHASFRVLDWETQPYPEWTSLETFDLIVMADVTYNTATFLALANLLEHLLKTGSKGARVICCGKRRHDEEKQFWKIVRERGFVIDQREIFSMDLEGGFESCQDGHGSHGSHGLQLIDFICMRLA
jgi:Lysine methyltransferase